MKANSKERRLARTLYRLCVVAGALDGNRARRVSRRLASSARRGSLPILAEFRRLVHLDHDRHAAVVESATPLAAPVRDGILRHTGPEPPGTLEGRIFRLVDRVAYINPDIDDAILATGSRPSIIPSLRLDSPRVMDSSGALDLPDIPKTLLVVGGGYIGL